MYLGWGSSDRGLHWQAVACADLRIVIWDWERMPATHAGLGGRMKGKPHSMNEFRNMHAICEWLLSLRWTCTSFYSHQWKPHDTIPWLRRSLPTPSALPAHPLPHRHRPRGRSRWKMLPAARRVLFQHAVHEAPCQGTSSHPWEESGAQLFWMRQLPLVVTMLWGRGAPTAEREGEKLRVVDSAIWTKECQNSPSAGGRAQAMPPPSLPWWLGAHLPGGLLRRRLQSDRVCGHVLRKRT